MHVLKFSKVLENAEIFLVTSLQIDSSKFYHRGVIISSQQF